MNKIETIKALKGYRSLIADQIMDCNESLDQLYKDAYSGNDIEMKKPIRELGSHEIVISPYLEISHSLNIKVNKN